MGTWRNHINGVTSTAHAGSLRSKSQRARFVILCQAQQRSPRNCMLASRLPFLVRLTHTIHDLVHTVTQALATTTLKCKARMNVIFGTLWPSGLRRRLKAPFRKGVGSNPTGVIVFGLVLRHDVLHTWPGPYMQRAPATLGPCRCFTNCCLAENTPGILVAASARGQSGCVSSEAE
jgi:hypothetical protein